MKLQKNLIKSLSLIVFVLIVAISCGELMTEPKGIDGEQVVIYSLNRYNTYQVRMGSTVRGIKPINMSNDWVSYIGGKKVLRPDGKTDWGWSFKKETGDYWENTYKQGKEMRAKCYGATIGRATDGNIYLMGIYYNYNTSGMPNQWMLIYITEDGTEKGYYGGGKDENKLPDNSTKWYPYDSFFSNGLGKLTDY